MKKPPLNFNYVNFDRRFQSIVGIGFPLIILFFTVSKNFDDIVKILLIVLSISLFILGIKRSIRLQRYKLAFKHKKLYSIEEIASVTGIKADTVKHDLCKLLNYTCEEDVDILLACYRYSIKPPKAINGSDFVAIRKKRKEYQEEVKAEFRLKIQKIEQQRLAQFTQLQNEKYLRDASTKTSDTAQ